MPRELFENESGTVVVVDDDENAHRFPTENGVLVWSEGVDEELYVWAVENSDYEDGRENPRDLDWPIKVSHTFHMEDTLGLRIQRLLSEDSGCMGVDFFNDEMGGRLSYPSISLVTHWFVYEDGRVELDCVEYNGTEYTESDA